jgi:cyclohexyl-isocyanide hydratase
MKIAYIVFDGVTWLDFIGFYDSVSRLRSMNYLPALTWDICAYSDTVGDNFGLRFNPTHVRSNLAGYDAIFIPGGIGTRQLRVDHSFIDWIKTAAPVKYKISVCSGSLILGAAGFLTGKSATTHFQEYDILKPFCGEVLRERIVEDGDTITAGAVSSSLDLGLYLCEKWAGKEAREEIRKRMDYRG